MFWNILQVKALCHLRGWRQQDFMGLDAKLRTLRRASYTWFSPMLSQEEEQARSDTLFKLPVFIQHLTQFQWNQFKFGEEKRPSSLKDFHKSSLLPVHEDVDDMCPSIWESLSSQALSVLAERDFDFTQHHTYKGRKRSRDYGFLLWLHQLSLCSPHKILYWNTL